ncbi:MAG: glycoside hydrolase family 15 protein, partial [Bacteroidetes bacterium]|nr:glycoside hydrolase family 15 protein [Bacteroidota bacterium]
MASLSSPYRPIEDYGLIGDMRTVALVSTEGAIDWCCLPRFDAPSIFGRILDHEKGGTFHLRVSGDDVETKQFYWPDTNVLVTRFLSEDGVGEVRDFMPVGGEASEDGVGEVRDFMPVGGEAVNPEERQIIRTARAVRGTVPFQLDCLPAFDFARAEHTMSETPNGVCFHGPDLGLSLASEVPLQRAGDGAAARFTLREGESTTFVLRTMPMGGDCGTPLNPDQAEAAFRATVAYWRDWLAQSTYTGRWRESVHRSVLALKLLTYAPTGAIVAAPTCGLPEEIGGVRNWDYRYTWIRDAAFTIYAFLRIGFTDEARDFITFLNGLCADAAADGRPLQIMYGIDGRTELTEETLDHLEGYRGSAPVRRGNGAYDQLQLDIYGELIDSIYIYDKYGVPVTHEVWDSVRTYVDWVCDHWDQP